MFQKGFRHIPFSDSRIGIDSRDRISGLEARLRSDRGVQFYGSAWNRTEPIVEIDDRRELFENTDYRFPFKIETFQDSGFYAKVHFGTVMGPAVYDSGTFSVITSDTAVPGGLFTNFDGTENDLNVTAISASFDYGVWLKCPTTSSASYANLNGGTYHWREFFLHHLGTNCSVLVTSAYSNYDDAVDFTSTDTDFGYVFIGRITWDSGEPVVQQYWRSDIVLPALTLVDDFLSPDSTNALSADNIDGGLYYEEPSSV